jgi:hypothetical protein
MLKHFIAVVVTTPFFMGIGPSQTATESITNNNKNANRKFPNESYFINTLKYFWMKHRKPYKKNNKNQKKRETKKTFSFLSVDSMAEPEKPRTMTWWFFIPTKTVVCQWRTQKTKNELPLFQAINWSSDSFH